MSTTQVLHVLQWCAFGGLGPQHLHHARCMGHQAPSPHCAHALDPRTQARADRHVGSMAVMAEKGDKPCAPREAVERVSLRYSAWRKIVALRYRAGLAHNRQDVVPEDHEFENAGDAHVKSKDVASCWEEVPQDGVHPQHANAPDQACNTRHNGDARDPDAAATEGARRRALKTALRAVEGTLASPA